MSRRSSRGLWWTAAAAWAAVIFALSSVPGSNLPPSPLSPVAHFLEYALLGVLIFGAIRLDRPALQAAILAIALASAYGVTDELHQSFVPLRSPDPLDWLTDTAGATVAVLAALRLLKDRSPRSA